MKAVNSIGTLTQTYSFSNTIIGTSVIGYWYNGIFFITRPCLSFAGVCRKLRNRVYMKSAREVWELEQI